MGKKVVSIKFKILKNGEKIKKDFHEKKKTILLSCKEKNLAMEQIRRIIERKGDSIKEKLKYDKDLEAIRKELEKKELMSC